MNPESTPVGTQVGATADLTEAPVALDAASAQTTHDAVAPPQEPAPVRPPRTLRFTFVTNRSGLNLTNCTLVLKVSKDRKRVERVHGDPPGLLNAAPAFGASDE